MRGLARWGAREKLGAGPPQCSHMAPHSTKRSLLHPRRSAASYRQAIATAIQRRIAHNESLAIRAIIAEAGGGSTDTVREELERAAVSAGARMLHGDHVRIPAEREAALREQLRHVTSERDMLSKANAVLERALRSASQPSQVIERQVSEIERRVQEAIEKVLHEASRLRRARERGTETVVVPDATLEARYQQLVQDHARLIEKFNRLNSRYFDATGEHFD